MNESLFLQFKHVLIIINHLRKKLLRQILRREWTSKWMLKSSVIWDELLYVCDPECKEEFCVNMEF